MDVSVNVGYFGPHITGEKQLIKELDDLGISCIWTAEAYGYDAVTPLSYFAALTNRIELGSGIMQIPGRSPAMAAMTAVTIDKLSNGRFRLGLGVSGPQVVEGWHGVSYGKPLKKTREYVQIVKDILNRETKTTFQGEFYNLPIYLAAIGPKNIELTAEIADGWLPFMYSPTLGDKFFNKFLDKGFEKSGDLDKKSKFNISAPVFAKLCDESEREIYLSTARNNYTLYVGGMGAKDKNFYFNLMCEYGYEDIATQIQELYLKGEKAEAESIFPDELLDDLTLVGSKERIKEKLEDWKNCNVTEISISIPLDIDTIRFVKECM